MSLCILLASLAVGQDIAENFDETVKEVEEVVVDKPQGEASAEVGGSLQTGNNDFYQVSARLTGGYKWKRNRLSALADALWGRGYVDLDGSGTLEDGERVGQRVETARRFNTEARYDRFFGKDDRNSIYVLGGALVDPFAGYDLRTHEQVGYSRSLIENDDTTMVIEVGADYAQENYVEGVDPNYLDVFALREMFAVKHAFNENFSFEEVFEAYENVLIIEDVRINNTLAATAKLSDKFSLKASHALRFDNLPVEGFRKTDQTVLVTLIATLLKTKAPEPEPEPEPAPCDCSEEVEKAVEEAKAEAEEAPADTEEGTEEEAPAEEMGDDDGDTVTAPRGGEAEEGGSDPE